MAVRLLLNPLGGVEGAPAAPTPAGGQAPPPADPPAAPPGGRYVSDADWAAIESFRARFEESERTRSAEAQRLESERLRALAAKGQHDEALTQATKSWEDKLAAETKRYQALESEVLGEKLRAAIDDSLAGLDFAGETPEDKSTVRADLRALIERDFESTRDHSGKVVVREKATGRPAAEVLKERLASRRYAAFIAARGEGSGATPPGSPPPPPVAPGNDFLSQNVAQWQQRQAHNGFGLTGTRPR